MIRISHIFIINQMPVTYHLFIAIFYPHAWSDYIDIYVLISCQIFYYIVSYLSHSDNSYCQALSRLLYQLY